MSEGRAPSLGDLLEIVGQQSAEIDRLHVKATALYEALRAHDEHMRDELGYSGPDDPALDPHCAEDWARIQAALKLARGGEA